MPEDPTLEVKKLLYEFTKEELQREHDRWESADKKAAGFTPVLALLLGASGFFGNWLLQEKMLPPQSKLEWAALICVVLVFVAVLGSWVFVLAAQRVRSYSKGDLKGKDLVAFFTDRDLPTLYVGNSYRFDEDTQINKVTIDQKYNCLTVAYYGMLASAFLLVFLLSLVGARNWLASSHTTNWEAVWNLLRGGFLSP
jgi:hypothetical protein